MYDISALYEASSVEEAIRLLQEHPEAKVIAGGSDVLIKMREGQLAGCELVSIYGIDAMRGVTLLEDGTIRIGSLTSFSHITHNPIVQQYINVLGEAVDQVGSPQIRNIGTVGGNTCNGVTSADSASTLMALDAVMEVAGPNGIRYIPISEWYISHGKVALEPAEIQISVMIPKEKYEGYKGHYIKYGMRNAMEIATLGCSVNVKLSADKKTFDDVRVGYGVAAVVPIRAKNAEAWLKGKEVTEENVKAFGQQILGDINPRDSWRAGREFRLHIAVEMAERALRESVRLSGGTL